MRTERTLSPIADTNPPRILRARIDRPHRRRRRHPDRSRPPPTLSSSAPHATRPPSISERDQGLAAARLDLDDARTFPAALDGIDRLFVMTGYTVAMTHQTKMITDAAADARCRSPRAPGNLR